MRPLAIVLALLLSPALSAKEPKDAPAVQFIDQTWVDVPKQAGPFALLGTRYDAENVAYGVATHWRPEGAPESLTLDVFVYPLGEADEAAAAARSMDEVDGGIAEYAKRGVYAKVQSGPRTPFTIVRPAAALDDEKKDKQAPFDPMPREDLVAEPSDQAAGDPMMQALAETMRTTNNHGLRESFTLEVQGTPQRSAAFTFYRNLYLFKLRISVPAADMAQEDFDRVADDAARHIVPRIRVMNFGTCGNLTISVPPDGEKRKQSKAEKDREASEGAAQLIRGMGRLQRDNCATSPGKAGGPESGHERTVIRYPADTWKSS